ncbi:MAG: sugar ABC transporter permease [Lacisediminihabitans sp.]
MSIPTTDPSTVALDRQDERLIRQERGLRGAWSAFRRRVSGGDLGSLPVVIGLVIIWAVFQVLNPFFLSAANLANLALECAAVGTIAIGVVLVLLVAQIDLSIGSISGLAAAVLAFGFVLHTWPLWISLVAAILAGAIVGLIYGFIYTRFGVPSFVITLAGLMGFLGLQLLILGTNGSINIPFSSWIVEFAQQMFLPPVVAYALIVVSAVLYGGSAYFVARQRRAAGLSATSLTEILIRSGLLLALLGVAVWYLNTNRGVGMMFVLFVALVVITNYALTRTKWGRSVYAIGGNVEAARRAGINVNRVFISVFVLGASFAALGGILAAARLASSSVSSGGGDTNLVAIAAAVIGGTSLFGGRGNAWSALLGIVVIQSIASGLTLLSLSSSIRFMITGAVLLLAVTIDSLSRRSRANHGQA